MAEIKQIKVPGTETPFEISSKYIQAGTLNKTWDDITALVEASTDLIYLDELPAETEASYNLYKNDIVLVPASTTGTANVCDEYVITRSKTTPYTYKWEKVGTTEADLANYQKIGKVLTSTTPSTNSTSEAPSYTATVSGSVKYTKAATVTGSTGSTATSNTSENGGHTINGSNFTFTGKTANLIQPNNGTVKLDHHSYTPQGSITGSQTVVAHSHTIGSSTDTIYQITGLGSVPTRASFDYVSGVKETGGTTNAVTGVTSSGTATVLTGVTVNASTPVLKSLTGKTGVTSATVIDNILSFPTANDFASNSTTNNTVSVATGVSGNGTTVAVTGVTASGSATVILSTGLTTSSAYQITGVGSAPTREAVTVVTSVDANTGNGGNHTINGSNFGFSGTAATLKHTQTATATTDYNTANVTVNTTTYSYTPEGSIGGSQVVGGHSHTYVTLPSHTHSVDSTENVEASVNLGAAITAHTHTLGNHTHNVTTSNN